MEAMMTDKDKLTTLLKEFGVGFEEERDTQSIWKEPSPPEDEMISVLCEEGMEKVDGYAGFFVQFKFDADGKFIKMIVAE